MTHPKHLLLLASMPLLLGTGAWIWPEAGALADPPQSQSRPGDDPGCRERPRPDLGAAAQQLGISEAELRTALGLPETPPDPEATGRPGERPPRPDLAAAAQQLGISEAELRTAMGLPAAGAEPRHPRPDFAAAAQQLGVTEDALKTALGVPDLDASGRPTTPPRRPDFAAAAQQLGVTEAALKAALGVPADR